MIIIAKRNFIDRCIKRSEIKEEMKLIKGSNTDYITPSGKVYSDHGNNMFYCKKIHKFCRNNYLYVNIRLKNGEHKKMRHHRLVAEAFIPKTLTASEQDFGNTKHKMPTVISTTGILTSSRLTTAVEDI